MLAWSMRRARRREKTRLKRGLNVAYHVSLRTYAAIRRTRAVRPACSLTTARARRQSTAATRARIQIARRIQRHGLQIARRIQRARPPNRVVDADKRPPNREHRRRPWSPCPLPLWPVVSSSSAVLPRILSCWLETATAENSDRRRRHPTVGGAPTTLHYWKQRPPEPHGQPSPTIWSNKHMRTRLLFLILYRGLGVTVWIFLLFIVFGPISIGPG
jgi:hypothetical protein